VDTPSTPKPIYEQQPVALSTLYGDLENFARAQGQIHTGTAGSVVERTNAGGYKFYAHQYYDALGKKVDRYIAGPVGNPEADSKAAEVRDRISALNEAVKTIRLLIREGFKHVDSKTYATIATLHNQSLFQAGAMLIGSHAYGGLLNQLGVRAAQYTTQDVDIARSAQLAFDPPRELSFLEVLKSSGIAFIEVPNLDSRRPSTSFKEAGKSFFQVDLLVPSADEEIRVVAVPELKAHATSLPYLQYLLGRTQETAILAREGCCMAATPTPERFAWHKLIVSQLRKRGDKALKDVEQAAVLMAALSERHPGALEEAAEAIPLAAKKYVRKAAVAARERLQAHPRALALMDSLEEPK
jgi:hypothetical protein